MTMTPSQQEKHDMVMALQARRRAEYAPDSEHGGFVQEAALDFGFKIDYDAPGPAEVSCSIEQLINFSLAAEAAGHFQYARRAGHTKDEALKILNRE